MISKAWEMLLDWLKSQPYWKRLQPLVLWMFGLVAVELLAYQYIQAEYGVPPSLRLFLGSYVSKQILLVFGGLAAVLLLFQIRRRPSLDAPVGRIRLYLRTHQSILIYRGGVVLGVLAVVAVGFVHLRPQKVSNIRIKFMDPPQHFRPEAFAYLIYELNRLQRDWFFEVDFKPFNPDSLRTSQCERCEKDPRPILCYAEQYAEGQPLIGITARSLGGSYFAEHRGQVSVISTVDQDAYAPISTYDYLIYCVIVQSILIHLDSHGGGLPPQAFEESTMSHGGVFQFSPQRSALKSTILAARFSPREEALLFNRFGAHYRANCLNLLTLDWLHSQRVADNLEKIFGVSNGRKP